MTDKNKLGPYTLNAIYTGDAKKLSKEIPDESVDLIFTDPVYQNIDDYRWLAETAVRVLKPDSACLVWSGKPLAARCQMIMEKAGLGYVYTLDYVVTAKTYRLMCYHLFTWTTPCLWMQKGHSVPRVWIPDTYISSTRPSGIHKWNKNAGVVIKWLDAFCKPDDIVFDPFTGGGTVPSCCVMLNRKYLAFEIDPKTAELARKRVRDTQHPLPGLQIEQSSLLIFDEHVA